MDAFVSERERTDCDVVGRTLWKGKRNVFGVRIPIRVRARRRAVYGVTFINDAYPPCRRDNRRNDSLVRVLFSNRNIYRRVVKRTDEERHRENATAFSRVHSSSYADRIMAGRVTNSRKNGIVVRALWPDYVNRHLGGEREPLYPSFQFRWPPVWLAYARRERRG